MTAPPAPQPTTATERAMLAALAGATGGPELTVAADPSGPAIAGAFLRWFLLFGSDGVPGLTRVALHGADLPDGLGLQGVTLRRAVCFGNCRFGAALDATDATVTGLEVTGGAMPMLRADRLTASGSVLALGTHIADSVLMSGAAIRGNLDLRGCRLGAALTEGPDAVCLLADGLTVLGNVLLSDGLHATGELRLNGCTIGRNLDLSGARLENRRGLCLSLAGGAVRGSVYATAPRGGGAAFASIGTVRLEGARIDGDLQAEGASLTATAFDAAGWTPSSGDDGDLVALAASGVAIGADARLTKRFAARGSVKMVNAQIGGDLDCNGATFDFPGEEALIADGLSVGGSAFMDARTRTTGLLRFVQARLTQGLFVDGTQFDRGGTHRGLQKAVSADELGVDVCGLYLASADVGGTFFLKDVAVIGHVGRVAWFSARNARAATIEDDLVSWERLDRIDLRDCDYAIISGLSDSEAPARLARLDREYAGALIRRRGATTWRWFRHALFVGASDEARAAALRFVPQPYIKLAQVFRRAGFDGAARDVMVRLERNRTALGGFSPSRQAFRTAQDGLIRYGYSPFRPVLFLLAWIAVSAAVFQAEWRHNDLVRAKENSAEPTAATAKAHDPHAPRPIGFDPVIYAADTLVPLVDLNQKKNFVHPHPSWFVVFNSFFGWLLTSFFAAGVGGLLRKGE